MVFGIGFAAVSLLFVLPMLFSDAVTVRISSDFIGQEQEFTVPGIEVIGSLLLFPILFGLSGAFAGLQARRAREVKLLASSNPKAPDRIRGKQKPKYIDRAVYRLGPDGIDMQEGGSQR